MHDATAAQDPARIDRVEARVIKLPLRTPVELASRRVTERSWLIVEVFTADGAQGLGFSYAGYGGGDFYVDIVQELLTPLIIGRDAHATGAIWGDLRSHVAVAGQSGAVMRCISALDIALWDRNAKVAKLPLGRYLGQTQKGATPVYVGAGYYGHPDEVGAMQDLAVAGYQSIKVKVGRYAPAREARRVIAVRDAVGDAVELAFDANGAWPNACAAAAQITALSAALPAFVEDPLPNEDLAGYRQLRQRTITPLSAGELLGSPQALTQIADTGAIDILQVDATACGGVTGFLKVAALCELKGLVLDTHWFPAFHLHLVQATSVCRRVEVFLDDEIINFGAITGHDAQIGVTEARAGTTPGHGVRLLD